MIDIATERLLSLPEAAKLFPSSREGKPTHASTIWRKIVSGELEGLYLGTRWVTSMEAIQRHAERQTEAALAKIGRMQNPEALSPPSSKERQRQIEERKKHLEWVKEECRRIGI